VFIRPLKHYLSLKTHDDVIQEMNGNLLDFVGFDIYKFSGLVMKSNPSMIEWLKSKIVYIDDGVSKKFFEDFIDMNYNPMALFHHYRSMGYSNYHKYIKSSQNQSYKKYLYALRGIINSEYVYNYRKIPYMDFSKTVENCREILGLNLVEKIYDLIEKKRKNFKENNNSNITIFDKYIEDKLKSKYSFNNPLIPNIEELNDFIVNLVISDAFKDS
jgi:uncharacterized protein